MNYDEFSFVNRQLAGMLQSGIPLEGALQQLCQGMRHTPLRAELTALETELAKGVPFGDALARRQLPPLYVAMLKVGVQSNQLPGVLLLLADYYQKLNSIWSRLKGLMVYPFIVLGTSLLLSLLVAFLYSRFMAQLGDSLQSLMPARSSFPPTPLQLGLNLWLPVGVLAAAAGLAIAALTIPAWRAKLRWRLPAFHEAGLSQLASALALMLQNGCSLQPALQLVRSMEAGTPAQPEIERWLERVAAGHKKFPEIASGGKVIPPLFVWLVAGSGEDWASGFRQAAEIYYARATQRIEVLLYAALPASVIALGLVIIFQVVPVLRIFLQFMNLISDSFDLS